MDYIDDIFLIWYHGILTLNAFLNAANSLDSNIQFMQGVEQRRSLPILDIE